MLDERNTANILLKLAVAHTTGSVEEIYDPIEIFNDDTIEIFNDDLLDKVRNDVYAEVATNTKGSPHSSVSSSPRSDETNDSSSETNDDKDKLLRYVLHYFLKIIHKLISYFLHSKQRNRMHAKLSRDRRKLFAMKVSEMITRLETQNEILFRRLQSEPVQLTTGWQLAKVLQSLY
jgi:hypothetical protein